MERTDKQDLFVMATCYGTKESSRVWLAQNLTKDGCYYWKGKGVGTERKQNWTRRTEKTPRGERGGQRKKIELGVWRQCHQAREKCFKRLLFFSLPLKYKIFFSRNKHTREWQWRSSNLGGLLPMSSSHDSSLVPATTGSCYRMMACMHLWPV